MSSSYAPPPKTSTDPTQTETTVPSPGKKEFKEKGSSRSVWEFFRPIFKLALAVVVVLVGVSTYRSFTTSPDTSRSATKSQTATTVSGSVPAEVALPIICGCESSGIPGVIKHFEDDGVTPLKNKPKPGEKASSATGGCQILSDLHDERAKKMGHDIKTPGGNMAYAKILYNESTPPTKHWEGVPGNTSKACWEPRLRALTLRSGEEVVYVVMATTGKWSDETVRPPQDKSTDYDGGGKKYTILWNGQVEENIPREGSRSKMPDKVYWFNLKSREEESIPISIKFY